MNEALTRVVYLSSNSLELNPDEMIDAVNDILSVSQQNNQAAGITGALIFNNGFFGQILEGPKTAVEETFERIQNDDRHHDVSLLDAKPIDTHSFESWSMGFIGSDKTLEAVAKSQLKKTDFDLAKLTGDEMFLMLSSLASQKELSDKAY